MSKKLTALALALIVLSLIVATALGFMMGLTHPIPWISLALLGLVIYGHQRLEQRSYLVWKDEYNTGIGSLDRDHRKLLNLINQLQTASNHYTGEEFERNALDELIKYTRYHFVREEKLMEEYGYSELEPHRREHQAMVAEVTQMISHYEEDHDATIDALLNFLKSWLIRHISGTDQQYSEFLASKGAS